MHDFLYALFFFLRNKITLKWPYDFNDSLRFHHSWKCLRMLQKKRTDKKNHKNKLLKMSQWYGWFGLLFSLGSQWEMGKIQCNDYVKSAITTVSRISSKLVHSKGQANKKKKNTHSHGDIRYEWFIVLSI